MLLKQSGEWRNLYASPTATAPGVVFHGADGTISRPSGYAYIVWRGDAEPANAVADDVWIPDNLNSQHDHDSLYVNNGGGVPNFQADTRANQPAAGTTGRLFHVTDEHVIERDDGTSWNQVVDLSHRNDTTNPHSVTHTQVGAPTDNPHGVTAAQAGAIENAQKVADLEHLRIGGGDNLWPDPTFEYISIDDLYNTDSVGAWKIEDRGVGDSWVHSGRRVARIDFSSTDNNSSYVYGPGKDTTGSPLEWIPALEGERFYIGIYHGANSTASNAEVRAILSFRDSDSNFIDSFTFGYVNMRGDSGNYELLEGVGIAPANSAYLTPGFSARNTVDGDGVGFVDSVVVRRHGNMQTTAMNGGKNIWVQSSSPTAEAVGDLWVAT